jgi:hypothetical protein
MTFSLSLIPYPLSPIPFLLFFYPFRNLPPLEVRVFLTLPEGMVSHAGHIHAGPD